MHKFAVIKNMLSALRDFEVTQRTSDIRGYITPERQGERNSFLLEALFECSLVSDRLADFLSIGSVGSPR